MSIAIAASTDIKVPLELIIEQEGIGGVTGKSPIVRLRDGTTSNSYLDFADNTFKTSFWTTQDQALAEIGNGHYSYVLDLSLITVLVVGNMLVAEFMVDDGGDIIGSDHDIIIIGLTTFESLLTDISLIRKSVTNRMEEAPGNPGVLTLYDDDDSTAILQFQLRDALGNGIASPALSPARRGKSII